MNTIAAAYLVLTTCLGFCDTYDKRPLSVVTIPQPSMDQCINQANHINKHRKDRNAMCVMGDYK